MRAIYYAIFILFLGLTACGKKDVTEFKVQTLLLDATQRVAYELRVLFKIRGINHVGFDVFERAFFSFQAHIDQQVGRIVFEHETAKQEFAQRSFE